MSVRASIVERLYLIQLAAGMVPMGDQQLDMSMGCYLIQTRDGRNILVDTGLPADADRTSLPPVAFGPNVVEQLAGLGIHPDDVNVVISTHFDVDHAGYHDAFPHAEHVVQRQHYELARDGHPRFAPARAHWDHPTLSYRQVEGDTELLPGIELIETSGHTPGHQSVLVRLPETGPVLLTIDAVPLASLFTPDRPDTPLDLDPEQTPASTRKLLALAAREQVVLTVFHHDGAQWRSLKRAPEWYG